MSTEIEKEIDLVVQHFVLDNEKSSAEVTNAFVVIGGSKPFEALGHAMFRAMLNTHIAQLQAEKATLVAQEPRGNIH